MAQTGSDVAPNPGDHLVFPAGLTATDKLTVNTYAANTTFNSIRIEDSGYTFFNSSIALNAGIICTSPVAAAHGSIVTALTQTQTWSTAGDGQLNISPNALVSSAVPLKP